MERRNHCKYGWFLGLGESIWKHKTVDEQMARRLGWIVGGCVTIHIYIYIYICVCVCVCQCLCLCLCLCLDRGNNSDFRPYFKRCPKAVPVHGVSN